MQTPLWMQTLLDKDPLLDADPLDADSPPNADPLGCRTACMQTPPPPWRLPRGHVTCDACWEANFYPPVNRMTRRCKNITLPQTYCHGMTKSVRKTNRLTKMLIFTILASFVCFFDFPDRNLNILYKNYLKTTLSCKIDQMPLLRIHLLYQITQRTADLLSFSLFCLITA